ncbi:MAG: hypothetical protein HC888_03375 [Candidatus Competibacteraceae bacterium]|nr:hypothetical protein [Candidatus Competibacteraceae bacterium]
MNKKEGANKASKAISHPTNHQPSLAHRIIKAFSVGKKSFLSVLEIHASLKKDGWKTTSTNPHNVIRVTLDQRKDLFKKKRSKSGAVLFSRK